MSEDYSESEAYSGYSYSEKSDEAYSEQKSDNAPENETQEKQRVAFGFETSIFLECGETGSVKIIPGPGNSFDIRFSVENSGNQQSSIVLSIKDGQCKVNADEALMAAVEPEQQESMPEHEDPSRLYEFRKL